MNAIDNDVFVRAFDAGHDHGIASGSWVIDGNMSDDELRAIISGYDDHDDEVMDLQPLPLSGEWAGDPTPQTVLADLGVDDDDDIANDLLTEYETGFAQGFWDEVIRSAKAQLSDDD